MLQPLCKTLIVLAAGAFVLPGGVWADDSPSGQAGRAYQAQWIWCKTEFPEPFQFARFQKTLEIASRPDHAAVYITADTFYRLWINGQLVMHGPARSCRGKATVDRVEVGRYLAQGRNTLMVEVFHGVCPFEALAQAPGLLCELEADFGGRKKILAAVASMADPEGTAGPPDLIHIAYPMHLKFFNAVIPTQPLFWILHTGLYERCSGNTELVRTVLPVIRRNLAVMDGWCNSDGLLESIPSWMFFDYANIRTDGASVTLNGTYARTLREAARLERLSGRAGAGRGP